MGDEQIHERIQTVTRTDGTREQWRIMVDPATGTEIDAYPITCCTDWVRQPTRVHRWPPATS
jgi:hypothetical protein